jgi:hypothetical protein
MEGLPLQTIAWEWICQTLPLNFRRCSTSTVKGEQERKQGFSQKQRPSCYLGDLPSLLSWPITPWNPTAWLWLWLSVRFFTVSSLMSFPHSGCNIKQNSSYKQLSYTLYENRKGVFHGSTHFIQMPYLQFLWFFIRYPSLYPFANTNILMQAKHSMEIITHAVTHSLCFRLAHHSIYTMVLAVHNNPLTAKAQIQYPASPCRICGKVALAQVLLRVLQISPISGIPPLPHTHSLITPDAI